MLDLGYFKFFESLSNNEIFELLNYSYEIINMNERVEKYFIKRFSFSNILELYKSLKTKLLIVTRGKNGADFVYDDTIIHQDLKVISEELDPNGAGDMFFASIINDYIHNNFMLSKNLIDTYFGNANSLTAQVVSYIGARTYKQPLYKINDVVCKCKINDFL